MLIDVTLLETIRVLLLLCNFILIPGYLTVKLLLKRDSIQGFQHIPLSLGGSLSISVLASYLARSIDGSLQTLVSLVVGYNLIGFSVLFARYILADFKEDRSSFSISKILLILLGLTILWFGVVFFIGPRIDYAHDAWYHVAHIRKAGESNQVFPKNPYWPDIELSRAYSVWHAILGTIVRTARVDTLVVWRVGNAFLAMLALWVIYGTAKSVFRKTTPSLLTAIVYMGTEKLTETYIYPYGITNVLLWASLGLFFAYYRTRQRGLLLSATMIGLLPIALHPQEYIFLCFGITSFLAVTLAYDHLSQTNDQSDVKAILTFIGLLLILGAPLLIIIYSDIVQTSADAMISASSVRHPIAQILTYIFPHSHKLSSFKIELLPFKAIALIVSPFVLTKPFKRKESRFLLTLTWAPLLAFAVPGLSLVTNMILRETYAWRLIALIPAPMIIALLIQQAIPWTNSQLGQNSDISRWVMQAIAIILIVLTVLSLLSKITISREIKQEGTESDLLLASPLQAESMFDMLDQAAQTPSVVLSDPWTSYAVPGMTKHTVVINMPAHGSREDMDTRFAKMRELLSSPTQSNKHAIEALERYEIEFIVVNKPQLDTYFYYGTQFYAPYTLDFLRRNPECFQNLYTDEVFEVYTFSHCKPTDLKLKGKSSAPFNQEIIQHRTDLILNADLTLLGYSLPTGQTVATGSEIDVTLYWKARRPLTEPYAVWMELLCDYPEKNLPYGKGIRRIREELTDTSFETATAFWLPIPPSGLESGDVLPQPFRLTLPKTMATGPCSLSVYVREREQIFSEPSVLPSMLMERFYLYEQVKITEIEIQ